SGWPHGNVGVKISSALFNVAFPNRLGEVFDASTGYRLPSGDTVEPDVSFISAARFQAGPPPRRGKFLEIVPNLIVEILSTPTAARDRGEKKAIYERNGVDEYWLVDVDRGEIAVYVLTSGRYGPAIVYRGTDRVISSVLPLLSVTVDSLLN
ncbi:MAG: Uma2 family endonuclease, partial [Candidatus Binatia bacterium]